MSFNWSRTHLETFYPDLSWHSKSIFTITNKQNPRTKQIHKYLSITALCCRIPCCIITKASIKTHSGSLAICCLSKEKELSLQAGVTLKLVEQLPRHPDCTSSSPALQKPHELAFSHECSSQELQDLTLFLAPSAVAAVEWDTPEQCISRCYSSRLGMAEVHVLKVKAVKLTTEDREERFGSRY